MEIASNSLPCVLATSPACCARPLEPRRRDVGGRIDQGARMGILRLAEGCGLCRRREGRNRHRRYAEPLSLPRRFNGRATRYGIGVSREGFEWAGRGHIACKRDCPRWTPPNSMVERQPELETFSIANGGMASGLENPLGSRALQRLFELRGASLTTDERQLPLCSSPVDWLDGGASGCLKSMSGPAGNRTLARPFDRSRWPDNLHTRYLVHTSIGRWTIASLKTALGRQASLQYVFHPRV